MLFEKELFYLVHLPDYGSVSPLFRMDASGFLREVSM